MSYNVPNTTIMFHPTPLLQIRNQMIYVFQVTSYGLEAGTAPPESSVSSSMSLQPPPPQLTHHTAEVPEAMTGALSPNVPSSRAPPYETAPQLLPRPTAPSPNAPSSQHEHLEHQQEPSPSTFPTSGREHLELLHAPPAMRIEWRPGEGWAASSRSGRR